MKLHIVRLTYRQPFFDTPTVGHFIVPARDAASAICAIRRYYRDYEVEFIVLAR
jgi:hypothetical protein